MIAHFPSTSASEDNSDSCRRLLLPLLLPSSQCSSTIKIATALWLWPLGQVLHPSSCYHRATAVILQVVKTEQLLLYTHLAAVALLHPPMQPLPTAPCCLIINTVNGLGAEYKELAIAIWARDSSLSFEELYDKLTDYKMYLK
ncbi:hypothetical protein BHE74_00033286 [Ensete ventricosum]|nr:hypothetical protein BHE74_00033286 [Ensete ventricosum]